MPSPFSKKNLPFVIFVLFVIGMVLLVCGPFKSNFGLQLSRFGESSSGYPLDSNSGDVSLKESQIRNRLQTDNPFGSMTVTKASSILDEVIQKAKNLSPAIFSSINDSSNTLNQLYSQIQNTLPGTMSFRNNITPSTNVNDILKESYKLSYPMERLMGNIAAMATSS